MPSQEEKFKLFFCSSSCLQVAVANFPIHPFFLLLQCDKSRRVSTDIYCAWPLAVVTAVAESLWDVLWLVLHSYVSSLKWTEFRLLFCQLVVSLRLANLIRQLSTPESKSALFVANSCFGRFFLLVLYVHSLHLLLTSLSIIFVGMEELTAPCVISTLHHQSNLKYL